MFFIVADLYINLFDALTKNPEKVGHGRDGYYFGITEEHSWYDLSKEIGKVLFELGITKAAEPTTFSREELPKYFGSEVNNSLHAWLSKVSDKLYSKLACSSARTRGVWRTIRSPSDGTRRRARRLCLRASSPRSRLS